MPAGLSVRYQPDRCIGAVLNLNYGTGYQVLLNQSNLLFRHRIPSALRPAAAAACKAFQLYGILKNHQVGIHTGISYRKLCCGVSLDYITVSILKGKVINIYGLITNTLRCRIVGLQRYHKGVSCCESLTVRYRVGHALGIGRIQIYGPCGIVLFTGIHTVQVTGTCIEIAVGTCYTDCQINGLYICQLIAQHCVDLETDCHGFTAGYRLQSLGAIVIHNIVGACGRTADDCGIVANKSVQAVLKINACRTCFCSGSFLCCGRLGNFFG